MRILRLSSMVAFLALSACVTPVNAPGAASDELRPLLAAEAAEANAENGLPIGTNFIRRGAQVDGNTIIYRVEVRSELGNATRGAPRGRLANLVEQDLRRDYCAEPAHRALVAAGGRVQTNFVDNIGRALFNIVFDRC